MVLRCARASRAQELRYNWRIIGAILILYYISMDVYVVIGCGSI